LLIFLKRKFSQISDFFPKKSFAFQILSLRISPNFSTWPCWMISRMTPTIFKSCLSFTLTNAHTNTQFYVRTHTSTQTYRQTDTLTQRHTDAQTHLHTVTKIYRHTQIHTQTHMRTQKRHPCARTSTQTQAHRHTNTKPQRHTNT